MGGNVEDIIDQSLRNAVQDYPHPLLFAAVTGSHAFGCATSASDYDVHGMHLLGIKEVLGLGSPRETHEQKMAHPRDGKEVDVSTHDLRKFVRLLLKGNGNVLEDLYSPLVLFTSLVHEELKEISTGCITKQLALHYKGMAFNQQRRMRANEIKKLLHIYRCLLMGIHLMRTRTLVLNLPQLLDEYRYPSVHSLIAAKRQGYDFTLDDDAEGHTKYLEGLTAALETARAQSTLPELPSAATRKQMEDLVIRVRVEGR